MKRLVNTGIINKDNLTLWSCLDAENTPSCCLGFGRDNGDFLAQHFVQQGRLPHIGTAD